MVAGGAAGKEVADLRESPVDPHRLDDIGASPAASRRRRSVAGSEVPHRVVKRWICLSERTGMIPGTTGTEIPAFEQRSQNL